MIDSRSLHSVTFGGLNTWDEWNLVPLTRPVINPPAPKVNQIEIPGADGVLDLTRAIDRRTYYNNRTGSLEFMVVNSLYWPVTFDEKWSELYSRIAYHLHGQEMTMTLDDDPDYFYFGRFEISEFASEKNYSKITIDYDVEPYKYSWESTLDNPDYYYYNHITLPNRSGEALFWVTVTIDPDDLGIAPVTPDIYCTFSDPPSPTTEEPMLKIIIPKYSEERTYNGTDLFEKPLRIPGLTFRKDMDPSLLQFQVATDWPYGSGGVMQLDFRKGWL